MYCGPPVMPQQRATPQPVAPTAAHYYVAVYYDDATQKIGTAWGYDSLEIAQQKARETCMAIVGRNCQRGASGRDGCVALATATNGNGPWGPGWGIDRASAVAEAMAKCRKFGGTDCKVLDGAAPCSRDPT